MLLKQLNSLAQLTLCLLLISLQACTLMNPFSECSVNSDCGDNAACIDGGICLSLELELDPCIGDEVSGFVEESCRAQLENLRLLSPDNVGGCFIIQTSGYSPRSSPFTWREGTLRISNPSLNYEANAEFNTHLYFISRVTTEEIDCDDYLDTLSAQCGSVPGCVLKLTSAPQRFDRTRLPISYYDPTRGSCNLSLNQNLIGVEALLDNVDNDCDGKVDA